jgi:hypothetical protein
MPTRGPWATPLHAPRPVDAYRGSHRYGLIGRYHAVRIRVAAPSNGVATVSRRGWGQTSTLRIAASRSVVHGDHNTLRVVRRHAVERATIRPGEVNDYLRAASKWMTRHMAGRPSGHADRAAFNRFMRNHAASQCSTWRSRAQALDRRVPNLRHVDIVNCSGVVIGDHNRVRTREDLLVKRATLQLGRLVQRDDRINRALFDVVSGRARDASELRSAIGGAVRGLSVAERRLATSADSGIATVSTSGQVDGAGAVMVGEGNSLKVADRDGGVKRIDVSHVDISRARDEPRRRINARRI